MRRLIAFAAAVAVAVASGCGGSGSKQSGTPPPATTVASQFAGAELADQTEAPDFTLRDQDGRTVRLADQRGKYVLLTFLYVNCPDVCPLIATNLNTALRAIGPARRDVRVLAVSVDPKGDTPKAVRAYVRQRALLPQFRYLLGTPSQLRDVWAKYNVTAVARSPEVVDHVAYVVLIDREGRRRVIYDTQVKARQVVHDLRVLTKKDGA
jgi:protein SCO1